MPLLKLTEDTQNENLTTAFAAFCGSRALVATLSSITTILALTAFTAFATLASLAALASRTLRITVCGHEASVRAIGNPLAFDNGDQ